jgi:hypothetical protein
MPEVNSILWGALGAGLVFVIGLAITWFWVFPWSLRRWMRKAAMDRKSKERKVMVEIGSLFSEVVISYVTTELIKYDKKAQQYTIDERLKPVINGVQMLLMKQLQLQINRFSGQLKKGINNAVGNTSNSGSPLGGIAKMLGIDLGEGQFGEILSLLGNFNQGNEGGGLIPGGNNEMPSSGIKTI